MRSTQPPDSLLSVPAAVGPDSTLPGRRSSSGAGGSASSGRSDRARSRRGPPPVLPEVAARVRVDQVRSHYRLSGQPVIAGLVYAFLVSLVVAPQAGVPWAMSWVLAKWVIGGMRLLEAWRFERDLRNRERVALWDRRFLIWLALDAATWGAMGLVFMPRTSDGIDGLLVASLAGVASVGVFTLFGRWQSGALFVSLTLLPAAVIHLVQGTGLGLLAGGGMVLFWGVLVLEARRGDQLFTELARLRHEHALMARRHRRAQERAEDSSAAKTRFLATVSHEIRTPLNGILGMAQLLQRGPLLDEQRRPLEVVASSAWLLRTIIDDILDMSRIESGRMQLQPQPIDLARLVDEVVDAQRALAEQKSLVLRASLAPGLAPGWLADPSRVRQVLHNLVGNAVKFTPQGRVDLAVATGPQGLRFTVTDTGPGIPQASLDRVFQAFEQADGAPSRAVGGSGLGLAIARQLARAMGGDVRCAETSSAGSTFVFDLASQAVALPQAAPQPAPAAPSGARAQPRVLVVEDNEVNALVAVESLKRFGFEPLHVTGGEAALELLQQEPVDVVLMDCQMPGLDGYETTQRWRVLERQRGLRRLPVVAVTANAAAGDRDRCLEAGMDDYLAKPFEFQVLRDTITRHLPGAEAAPRTPR